MTEDQMWDMTDEEAEAAFKAAKAQEASPDTQIEQQDVVEETTDVEEFEQEEELENGLDQPEEESDHDSAEDDTAEVEDDESGSEEESPDGDDDSEEEDTSKPDTEGVKEEAQPVLKQKFKANGREYEFTMDEVLEKFPAVFGQAMDYTKKMQAIKPWRKTIDAIETAKLSHDDVNLMIDVLKGDKDAITEVLKRTGVDTLDLDTENSKYVAKDYGRDEKALAIKDVVDEIYKDKEYAITHSILSEKWDDASWNEMTKDPQMIKALHIDVKSGLFDKLQPRIDKLKMFYPGKTDLDYYAAAARELDQETTQKQQLHEAALRERDAKLAQEEATKQAKEAQRLDKVRAEEAARKATQKASAKRKAAAPTKGMAGKREVTDYLDDSDEAFDEWYKKLDI